ncbi:MAG: biotin--[acetyl-CoA-carboxylase] ligase, partial [Deltaproteobacteria bacterium]|nr:biotin--[acetyl-CoA-carboxylase] ligase [Deltaproteobacteria bacterium]
MEWVIHREGVIGSTNDRARELAVAGAAEGAVIVAEGQTGGRGREGHAWFSPPGTGLYCSLVLRPAVPAERIATLTLVAGLAVCEAIDAVRQVKAQVKWPNDVWCAGKKVAGILAERIAMPQGSPAVVLGIGININTRREDFPPELRDLATSLVAACGHPVEPEEVLHGVLRALADRYAQWRREG